MVGTTSSLLALVLPLAAFVVLGLRAARSGADVDDYLVARSSQGPVTLGLSFMAAGMGAWILFAPPEIGAGIGATAVAGYAIASAIPLVLFGVLGPRVRAILPHGRSLPELVRHRFGPVVHAYVALVSVAYMLCFVTAELTAVGGVTAILSGLDPRIAIAAVVVATLAYTAYGGLRASLVTDRYQAWLIVALVGFAVVAALVGLRDPAGAWTDSALLGVDRVGLEVAATLVLAVTAANLFHQGYWQRVWAARDDAALRRGAALGAALTVPVVAAVGALGILATGTGIDLGTPPVPLFALLAGLPAWSGVLVLVLGVALVASSVDTLETGLASLVLAERPATSLRGARGVTVALMVPATLVALQGHSVLRLFLVADLLAAGMAVPALLSLWRRATAAGALVGGLAGLVGAVLPGALSTGSIARGLHAATFPGAVPTLPPFVGALGLSAAVAVGVSLLSRPDPDPVPASEPSASV